MIRRASFCVIFFTFAFGLQAQWVSQWTAFPEELLVNHIHAIDANNVWISAKIPGQAETLSPRFSRTENAGMLWQAGIVPAAESWGIDMIFGLNGLTAWACLQSPNDTGGYIVKTSDGGQNWAFQETALFHRNPKIVHFFDADSGIAIGDPHDGHFEIYTTVDGGNQWDSIADFNMPLADDAQQTLPGSFWSKGDTVWFGGFTQGRIFVSYNRGYQWYFLPFPNEAVPFVMFRDSMGLAGNLDPVFNQHQLYFTQDYGVNWVKVAAQGLIGSFDITFVRGSNSTLLASGMFLMVSNNWGESWEYLQEPATPLPFYSSISFQSISNGWLGSRNDNILSQGGIFRYNGPALALRSLEPAIAASLFPNPADAGCTIILQAHRSQPAIIHLHDLSGRELLSVRHDCYPGENHLEINLSGIPAGMYLLHGVIDGGDFRKVLIKR